MKKVFMKYILPVLGVIAVVILDQLVKELCLDKIGMYNTIVLIEDVFELRVIPNYGMAWGMLQNKQWIFVVITPVVLALAVWFYLKMPAEKKFAPMRVLTVLLAGGAIGNLLDRMFRGDFCQGYVVDMFYFKAIDFPVFNVADSFICVSFALLAILVIFKYSEEDFDRMFGLKKKAKAVDEDSVKEAKENIIEEVSKDAEETVAVEETVSEE
ncbi:MAG: signal peptidase II [Lachnospiraceae bacterium]|nr:signal peptidase II [Lachnospiraceae bacterium]